MSRLLTALALCCATLTSLPTLAATGDSAVLARGEYLAQAADCSGCHRSPRADSGSFSGGLQIATPLGTIIGTNITPSTRYGIGGYSEAQFRRALTEGIRADGSHLYPAMPYSAYRGMSDDDIHALYRWLREGVAPVDAPVTATKLDFPFSIRGLMALWNPLNAKTPEPVTPLTTPELKRGYYLVEVLGHCSACHSPRNFMQGESTDERFSGGRQGGWLAPNITADANSGIGGWSDGELIQYLHNGQAPGKGVAAGGMAEVVEHSLRHLSPADLQAIAAYLRKIPAVATPGVTTAAWQATGDALAAINAEGKALYQSACAACHRDNGSGAYNNTFPSLTHNTTTGSPTADNLVMVILDGVHRQGAVSRAEMPGFRDTLSDQQIADLTRYVASNFGNPQLAVNADFVATARDGGPRPWLLTALPWLGAALVIAIIVLLVALSRRRRAASRNR